MTQRFIQFHFILRDGNSRLLDTSRGNAPMTWVEGSGQVIEGLAEALAVMAVGETRLVRVPPERAYGLRDPTLVQKVPRARVPVPELKAGDQFQTGPDRHDPVVTVVAVEGDDVVLDANHPLAGQTLHFEVELVAVRPATPQELQQAADAP